MNTNPNDFTHYYPGQDGFCGLTKREYFAAMAMQGICAHHAIGSHGEDRIAVLAVRMADCLISALNEQKGAGEDE